jgi:acetyl-CoA C-acetyltransferase
MAREVVVLAGVRTAIGDYGGALKDVAPTALGAIAVREAVARAKIEPAEVGHAVFGSVIHGEARDMYLSRVAAIEGGLPVGTPCLTVNRLCGSGLQAIVSAAQHILLGDTDCVIGAGAESMSRAAYFMPGARWGQRMGDTALVDAMTGALHDPFGHGHMGITAENVAAKYGFTREDQDAFALQSHTRAANALEPSGIHGR